MIHHAATTGKKLLGVCLGMQLVHRYYKMPDVIAEMGLEGPADEVMIDLFYNKEIDHDFLHRIESHMRTGFADGMKHNVNIVPGTILHRLLGRDTAIGASFHNWRAEDSAAAVTVNA